MAINSRAKGARGELAFCKAVRDLYGINSRRSQQYCGSTGDAADVVSDLNCHLEIKCVERLNVAEAFNQARTDSAKSGRTPVVAHKKNRGPWLITMALSDLGRFIEENQHHFVEQYEFMKALETLYKKGKRHENTNGSNQVRASSSSSISDDELSSNPMLKE